MIMDNLSANKDPRIRRLVHERGCALIYLPPYSPDLNPIEEAFSKVKGLLLKGQARNLERLAEAVTAKVICGYFEHSGYQLLAQHLCQALQALLSAAWVPYKGRHAEAVGLMFWLRRKRLAGS